MDNNLFQNKYRVKTIRLENWDYSSNWWYFVTICVKDFNKCLGEVKKGKVELSRIGEIVNKEILETEKVRKSVKIDEYVIMPNHIHMIIILDNSYSRDALQCVCTDKMENKYRDTLQCVCTDNKKFGPQKNNLASIIRGFKGSVKRICNKQNIPFFWQSNYYEHIIRTEKSMEKIKLYVRNNPIKWDLDEYW